MANTNLATCYCQLAGTIWSISSTSAALISDFQLQYQNFVVPEQPAVCKILVEPSFVAGRYMEDKGIPTFKAERERIWATHAGSYHGYYSLKEAEAHFTIADKSQCPQLVCSMSLSICNIMRLMMMIWLPHYQRLLLHSASLVLNGEGYLFLGQSGFGKSTLAHLFDQEALTGDMTLVGPEAESGKLFIWPTFLDYVPWKERTPEGVPLKRIYLLSGHKPYSLAEIPLKAGKIKAILENSVGIGWLQAKEMIDNAMKIVEACPLQRITYLLTGDGQEELPRLREIILQGRL